MPVELGLMRLVNRIDILIVYLFMLLVVDMAFISHVTSLVKVSGLSANTEKYRPIYIYKQRITRAIQKPRVYTRTIAL